MMKMASFSTPDWCENGNFSRAVRKWQLFYPRLLSSAGVASCDVAFLLYHSLIHRKTQVAQTNHVLLLVLNKRMFEKADPFKAEQFLKMLL